MSCLGDDYLLNGHDPSYWAGQLNYFTQYHCTTARLGFQFSDEPSQDLSHYDYAKMNTVLNYLSSVGVKAILVDQNPGPSEAWAGGQAWINDWLQLTRDFKGDSRIAAFEIYGEPWTEDLASNIVGANNNQTIHNFDVVCASLIDQIRAIDPSRTIMYPNVVGILTDDPYFFLNDIQATGVTSKGNMLYDVIHPYYFEDYPLMDARNNPTDDADYLWDNYVLPQINYFGAQNCWCGETFPWDCTGHGFNGQLTIHLDIQKTFEVRMINYFVSVGMGFQMWCFWGDQAQDINVLDNSNYYTIIHS